MRFTLILIFTCLILSGCTQTASVTSRFDAKEAAFILADGTATLRGQAFMQRRDGSVVHAAGSKVQLVPVTAFSEELFALQFVRRGFSDVTISMDGADPRYFEMMRHTRADSEGRFTFAGLADGDYFVTTSVHWETDGIDRGGYLLERLSIRRGKDVEVILAGD